MSSLFSCPKENLEVGTVCQSPFVSVSADLLERQIDRVAVESEEGTQSSGAISSPSISQPPNSAISSAWSMNLALPNPR